MIGCPKEGDEADWKLGVYELCWQHLEAMTMNAYYHAGPHQPLITVMSFRSDGRGSLTRRVTDI